MEWTKVCDEAIVAKNRGDLAAVLSALEKLSDAREVHHVMYWLKITAIADHSKGKWVPHTYPEVPPYWSVPIYRPRENASRTELIKWAAKWLPVAIEQDGKAPTPQQPDLFDSAA